MAKVTAKDPFTHSLCAIAHEVNRQNRELSEQIEKTMLKTELYEEIIEELWSALSVIKKSAGFIEEYYERHSDEKCDEHLRLIDNQVEEIVSILEKMTEHHNLHANPA